MDTGARVWMRCGDKTIFEKVGHGYSGDTFIN